MTGDWLSEIVFSTIKKMLNDLSMHWTTVGSISPYDKLKAISFETMLCNMQSK